MRILLYEFSGKINTLECHSMEISDREHDKWLEVTHYEDGSLTLEKLPIYDIVKIEVLL